jgi:hypothetical protein
VEKPVTEETTTSAPINLFGMADAAEVSDNPWDIAPNTYYCTCIDVSFNEKDDGTTSLRIKWQISEPESEYDGNKVSQYHTVCLTKLYKDMDPDEKRSMKYYKLNMRRAFDLSETEMNSLTPQDLLGRKAYVTTVTNDTYTNVKAALCKRLYDEENEAAQDAVTTGGFGI